MVTKNLWVQAIKNCLPNWDLSLGKPKAFFDQSCSNFLVNFYTKHETIFKLTDNFEIDGRRALAELVDGLDTVLASILRHAVTNVKSYVAEVERYVEARRRRQWFAVVVELNTQIRVMKRLHLALKVSSSSLRHFGCALKER